jgi:hypothetical protein
MISLSYTQSYTQGCYHPHTCSFHSPDWVMIVPDESHRFELALEFILSYDWA